MRIWEEITGQSLSQMVSVYTDALKEHGKGIGIDLLTNIAVNEPKRLLMGALVDCYVKDPLPFVVKNLAHDDLYKHQLNYKTSSDSDWDTILDEYESRGRVNGLTAYLTELNGEECMVWFENEYARQDRYIAYSNYFRDVSIGNAITPSEDSEGNLVLTSTRDYFNGTIADLLAPHDQIVYDVLVNGNFGEYKGYTECVDLGWVDEENQERIESIEDDREAVEEEVAKIINREYTEGVIDSILNDVNYTLYGSDGFDRYDVQVNSRGEYVDVVIPKDKIEEVISYATYSWGLMGELLSAVYKTVSSDTAVNSGVNEIVINKEISKQLDFWGY